MFDGKKTRLSCKKGETLKVNWESLFKSHIRERGYDYHADNRVRIIRADEHKIEAQKSSYEGIEEDIPSGIRQSY